MRQTPRAFLDLRTGLAAARALALAVLVAALLAGCTSQSDSITSVVTPAPSLPALATMPAALPTGVTVTKLEVVHFHPTRQCTSCTTVGIFANATVGKYFAGERASGRIVFREINTDLEENRAIVEQYGASGSSLMLGIHTSDGGFYSEENMKVWYRIDDRQRYMDYLKGVIEKRLSGDLSAA